MRRRIARALERGPRRRGVPQRPLAPRDPVVRPRIVGLTLALERERVARAGRPLVHQHAERDAQVQVRSRLHLAQRIARAHEEEQRAAAGLVEREVVEVIGAHAGVAVRPAHQRTVRHLERDVALEPREEQRAAPGKRRTHALEVVQIALAVAGGALEVELVDVRHLGPRAARRCELLQVAGAVRSPRQEREQRERPWARARREPCAERDRDPAHREQVVVGAPQHGHGHHRQRGEQGPRRAGRNRVPARFGQLARRGSLGRRCGSPATRLGFGAGLAVSSGRCGAQARRAAGVRSWGPRARRPATGEPAHAVARSRQEHRGEREQQWQRRRSNAGQPPPFVLARLRAEDHLHEVQVGGDRSPRIELDLRACGPARVGRQHPHRRPRADAERERPRAPGGLQPALARPAVRDQRDQRRQQHDLLGQRGECHGDGAEPGAPAEMQPHRGQRPDHRQQLLAAARPADRHVGGVVHGQQRGGERGGVRSRQAAREPEQQEQ